MTLQTLEESPQRFVAVKVPCHGTYLVLTSLMQNSGDRTRVIRALALGDSLTIQRAKHFMTRQTSGAANARQNRRTDGDILGTNSEIGRKLKQYYDELVSDEVPDRFAQLLSQLEEVEPAQQKD